MKKNFLFLTLCLLIFFCASVQGQLENLSRGIIVLKKDAHTHFVSWRYLTSDPQDVVFDVYCNGKKVKGSPITHSTCFEYANSSQTEQTYTVKARSKSQKHLPCSEASYTLPANAPVGYINIPLRVPQGGVTPNGQAYTYSPNDVSIGDVDGDGNYELFVKWDPSNSHDNSHRGYTGNVYVDCYRLNGTFLWRIDLGHNVRAGAHYTQLVVYDLDGDGISELVMRTSDGTVDGLGKVIGDAHADYRDTSGYIFTGKEYLTVFNGRTGAAMSTIDYNPARGIIQDWGDHTYPNRVDRFLACVAYLDGKHPSFIMCRGYYTRTVLVAYDWKGGKLTQRWIFDSNDAGNASYAGQGNHSLRVGDVDGDGCDEIVYGACVINNDGKGLYSTGLGHGDAMQMTVMDPTRKGMQIWSCLETKGNGSVYRDAQAGEILHQLKAPEDVGRCMAADIDPTHAGVEMWSSDSHGIWDVKGNNIDTALHGLSYNMGCWWDGDLLRELLDKNEITKYNYNGGGVKVIFKAEGCTSNNGTKKTPAIQGDLIGDWREEVLLRTEDNKNLRLYVSMIPTNYRFHTFLEDRMYRLSLVTENVAYNQPTQPSFYFGPDLGKCFPTKELVVKGTEIKLDAGMNYDSYQWSVGGTERTRTITTRDILPNKRTKIELTVTFRGYPFTDYVYVTLNN